MFEPTHVGCYSQWRPLGQALAKLANKTTLADPLHNQIETAQQILFEGGGDYALTVKENQKELVQTLARLLMPGEFSPSAHDADSRTDAGTQSQSAGDPTLAMPVGEPRASGFSRSATGCAVTAASATKRQENH